MQLSTYVYPWDLARLGVREVFEDLNEQGVTGVDLTASYHTITAFSPRGRGPHVFSLPRGGVCFPIRRERYGLITPADIADAAVLRVWPEAAAQAARLGIALSAWTVALFAPWLAQDHPATARVLPSGERSNVGVCPAAPAVREYLGALCADVAEQFGLAAVKLENVAFPDFDYGWHRPRALTTIPDRARELLSMCFCVHCVERGRSAGIQVDLLQVRLAAQIDAVLAGPGSRPVDDEELVAYKTLADGAVVELVSYIAESVRQEAPATRVTVAAPIEPSGSAGVDLASVIDEVGGVQLWSPRHNADAIAALLPLLQQRPDLVVSCLHPPGFDHPVGSPTWLEELRSAIAVPVDEISLYHYGLLPRSDFDRGVRLARDLTRPA